MASNIATRVLSNIFNTNKNVDKNGQPINTNMIVKVSEIKNALNELNIEGTCEDIVYRNKDKIKKIIRKICLSKTTEIQENSYSIINLKSNKILDLYYNIDKNAFMNIAQDASQQVGLDINYTCGVNDEDDEESNDVFLILQEDKQQKSF